MTIRKRIDEAIALRQLGYDEAALILSLVAVAGAARRKYPKEKKGDSDAFRTYLKERIRHTMFGCADANIDFAAFYYKGKRQFIEDLLYLEFRCSLIHEATMPNELSFDQSPNNLGFSISGTRITLGRGWVSMLIDVVVNDPNLEPDFNDIRRKPLHDLTFQGITDKKAFLTSVSQKHQISVGRLHIILGFIATVGPNDLKKLTPEEMRTLWREVRSTPEKFNLNGGGITGLSTSSPEFGRGKVFLGSNGISEDGLALMQDLLSTIN